MVTAIINGGEYPTSLFMPSGGWDTDFITCGTTNAKPASSDSSKTNERGPAICAFTLSLSSEEASTNNIHFAISFGENCMDDLSVQSVILLE